VAVALARPGREGGGTGKSDGHSSLSFVCNICVCCRLCPARAVEELLGEAVNKQIFKYSRHVLPHTRWKTLSRQPQDSKDQ
jgi:hypothetical protein